MATQLYGVKTYDPLTLAGAVVLLSVFAADRRIHPGQTRRQHRAHERLAHGIVRAVAAWEEGLCGDGRFRPSRQAQRGEQRHNSGSPPCETLQRV